MILRLYTIKDGMAQMQHALPHLMRSATDALA